MENFRLSSQCISIESLAGPVNRIKAHVACKTAYIHELRLKNTQLEQHMCFLDAQSSELTNHQYQLFKDKVDFQFEKQAIVKQQQRTQQFIQNCKHQKPKVENEINKKAKQISKLQAQVQELTQKQRQLSQEQIMKKQELQVTRKRSIQLDGYIEKLNQFKLSKEQTISKLKDLYDYQQKRLKESESDIDQIRYQIQSKQKSSYQYQNEIAKLTRKDQQIKRKITQNQQFIEQQQQNIKQGIQDQHLLKKKLETLQQKIKILHAQTTSKASIWTQKKQTASKWHKIRPEVSIQNEYSRHFFIRNITNV